MRDEDVAHIFTFRDRTDRQPFGQERREIFQAVHGEIDAAVHEGGLDFLREQALVADHRGRRIEDPVALRLDDFNFDLNLFQCLLKLVPDPVNLPECELTPAAADPYRGCVHGRVRLSSPKRCLRMEILLCMSSSLCSPVPFFRFVVGVWRILFTIRRVSMSISSRLSEEKWWRCLSISAFRMVSN